MDQVSHLDGGPEEWLRRIAVGRPFVGVPDNVAVALLAVGFAARRADGSLSATKAGRSHLDACGRIVRNLHTHYAARRS
jgi:hypothetical protein